MSNATNAPAPARPPTPDYWTSTPINPEYIIFRLGRMTGRDVTIIMAQPPVYLVTLADSEGRKKFHLYDEVSDEIHVIRKPETLAEIVGLIQNDVNSVQIEEVWFALPTPLNR